MNPPRKADFPATRWSLVAASQSMDDPRASAALTELCQDYWYPVYEFIRRSGRGREDTEDLTQSFFLRVLEKRTFTHAVEEKGKFRTFLLTSLQRFLINQHEHDSTAKRAPQRAVSFDAMEADERFHAEPQDTRSPDQLFDRRFFRVLMDTSVAELREEWAEDGQAALFDALEPQLSGSELEKSSRQELAAQFGIEVAAIAARRIKLKQQLRAKLYDKVAETLRQPSDADIKAELDALLMQP